MKKFKVGQRCTIISQIMICTEQDEFEPTCNETFVDGYDLEVKEVHEDCIVVKLIDDNPEESDYSGLFDTDWIIGKDEFDNLQ